MNYLIKASSHELLIEIYLKLGKQYTERYENTCNPVNNVNINTIMIAGDSFYGQNYSRSYYEDYTYLFIMDGWDIGDVLSRLHIDTLNNTYPIF